MPGKPARRSELHLIVPGICGPLADAAPLASSPLIERWIKTLSKSRCSSSQDNSDANDVLASIFQLDFKNDFPSAAFTLLANDLYDPEKFYMHADPVHLQADIDSVLLTPGADLNISDAEADTFCQVLNQHFAEDGLTFHVMKNKQWFVSSNKEIKLKTTPLVYATARNINFLLPSGNDAVRWKQLLTEAQMLLHAHELNAVRDAAGRMSINSLWFYGSGKLMPLENTGVNNLCGDDDVLKGFSRQMKCDYLQRPDSVNDYLDYLLSCEPGTKNVLHLSELEHLVNYTDVQPWLKQLEKMLDGWLYPLLGFSNKNNIKLTLYPCNEKKYQFSKYDVLKFWRKDPLEKHVNCY